MWVRKSAEEIEREQNYWWRRWGSLMLAGLVGFAMSLQVMCGSRRFGPPTRLSLGGLGIAIGVGLLAMVAAHLLRVRWGKPLFTHQCGMSSSRWGSSDWQICSKCQQLRMYERDPSCGCGGQFEDLNNWKWVEDEVHDGDN